MAIFRVKQVDDPRNGTGAGHMNDLDSGRGGVGDGHKQSGALVRYDARSGGLVDGIGV